MKSSAFALKVQRLPRKLDQALVMGEIAGQRSGTGWFTPSDVSRLFEVFRLPRPGNVSDTFSRLGKGGYLTRRAIGGSWAMTPEGGQRVLELIEGLDIGAIAVAEAGYPGAVFGSERQPLLDPMLAPQRWAAAIARLLERYPFETNVFCMTRFPSVPKDGAAADPVGSAIEVLRTAMTAHGLMD